jgi:hypothetical protein
MNMSIAKIRLSPTEMEMVTDAELILTKNAILKKVQQLLGNMQLKQQELLMEHSKGLSPKISGSTSKISKGENYKGLPYLILDYPRVFENEKQPERQAGIFAIRTMFWWGNFFSVTLHLSGFYKKEAEERIITSLKILTEKGFFYYINEDPWEHHFEKNNYIPVQDMSKNDFERSIRNNSFIKLAGKISLKQWNDAEEILLEKFKVLIGMLAY